MAAYSLRSPREVPCLARNYLVSEERGALKSDDCVPVPQESLGTLSGSLGVSGLWFGETGEQTNKESGERVFLPK